MPSGPPLTEAQGDSTPSASCSHPTTSHSKVHEEANDDPPTPSFSSSSCPSSSQSSSLSSRDVCRPQVLVRGGGGTHHMPGGSNASSIGDRDGARSSVQNLAYSSSGGIGGGGDRESGVLSSPYPHGPFLPPQLPFPGVGGHPASGGGGARGVGGGAGGGSGRGSCCLLISVSSSSFSSCV